MQSSSRPFRWLALLLAIFLFASGTLLAVHTHKDARDCSLCVVGHSPAAQTAAVAVPVSQRAVVAELAADPIARTADLTRTHVIRPPPVVA